MPKNSTHEAIATEAICLIQLERERQQLSKMALAQKAGLSRQMIGYVESGERMPTLDTLLRMTEALGIKLEKVLKQGRKNVTMSNSGVNLR